MLRISIVTPSYNQGSYLEECIDSILSQNYPNLDYIIMDGGSTDGSVEIIKKYERHLSYWQSCPDGGQYHAINAGFRRATGEVMAWLNSDDKYHPGALHLVNLFFQSMPSLEWIMGRPTLWDPDGLLVAEFGTPAWSRQRILSHTRDDLYIQQESTFWRKRLWEAAGHNIDTRWSLAGDFELWARFSRFAPLIGVDALLGGFRGHSAQKTARLMDVYEEEVRQILVEERAVAPGPAALLPALSWLTVEQAVGNGSPVLGRDAFSYFSYARTTHRSWLAASARVLCGGTPCDQWDLLLYQRLLCHAVITQNLPKGARILELGEGTPELAAELAADYDYWVAATTTSPAPTLLHGCMASAAPIGAFSPELPQKHFDLVFSLAQLWNACGSVDECGRIIADVRRILKPGGVALHCFEMEARGSSVSVQPPAPHFFATDGMWRLPFDLLRLDPFAWQLQGACCRRPWLSGRDDLPVSLFSVHSFWEKPASSAARVGAVKEPRAAEGAVTTPGGSAATGGGTASVHRLGEETRNSGESMRQRRFGIREKERIQLSGMDQGLAVARAAFDPCDHLKAIKAIDIYEQLAEAYPSFAIPILAELYDSYLRLPRDRYHLYQARHFDFGILPGDKVLDLGSGHLPFPLATHLCDITLENHGYGRGGVPFKKVEGKPLFECPVEETPFADKEFDFVYCSHVLEHASDPERACRELMRIGKRGYIETPTRGKDIFLSSARISNHTRYAELRDGKLIFNEYSALEVNGLGCDILQAMHSNPQSEREKAFAALVWLKAEVVNTMLLWEGSFEFERHGARRRSILAVSDPAEAPPAAPKQAAQQAAPEAAAPVTVGKKEPASLRFLQVHTFYPRYLDEFYRKHPGLIGASFIEQINALVRDGFSGIHIFAPYMAQMGYRPHLVIANSVHAQACWLRERGINYTNSGNWLHDIVRMQIEEIKPEILYIGDPINFDSRFLRSLSYTPKLVLGWRAANIAPGTDWSSYDVLLSSLTSLRNVALQIGARAAEHFFPGFACWTNQAGSAEEPTHDVVFAGSWTHDQHARRNEILTQLALAAAAPDAFFTLALYLNADTRSLPAEVNRYNHGPRFGVAMQDALRSGRIVVDSRGVLEYRAPQTEVVIDLARRETANMRIFEVTGSGRLLLTEHHDNLSHYFEPGREIETFRNFPELLTKIRYYLEHPTEREAIARRGHERCIREYSMEKRAEDLDRIVRKYLREKQTTGSDLSQPARWPEAATDEFRKLVEALYPCGTPSALKLLNLYTLARQLCQHNIEGNFVCCGADSGTQALLAAFVKRYSKQPRRLYCFLPPERQHTEQPEGGADARAYTADPLQELVVNCDKLDVAELVTPIKGSFEETLPQMRDRMGMIAFLHMDCGLYGSTRAILDNLYDRLMNGALLQVDDYGVWEGCRSAIREVEAERTLAFDITQIDGTGIWFGKPDRFPVDPGLPGELIEEFRADDPVTRGIVSQMSANERFQLYYALRHGLAATGRLTRFVEIGSFSGASLFLAHQGLARRGKPFQAICVEPGGTGQFHEVVKLLKQDVLHLPMLSHEAAQRLAVMFQEDRLAEFIFVDGDHRYEAVRRDILDFYPLLAPGGIMMFHDYLPPLDDRNREAILCHHGNSEPGIRQACQELMEERYGCETIELPLLYPTDPTQTQPHLPIIPGVFSTIRAYRKPGW